MSQRERFVPDIRARDRIVTRSRVVSLLDHRKLSRQHPSISVMSLRVRDDIWEYDGIEIRVRFDMDYRSYARDSTATIKQKCEPGYVKKVSLGVRKCSQHDLKLPRPFDPVA